MESIKHVSYWENTIEKRSFPKLEQELSIDTAIIGGGIFGITSALLLKENGVEVALFEGNQLGYGATGATTAKVTSQHGLIYQDINSAYGEDKAKLYAQANEAAIKLIKEKISKYHIDCDFMDERSIIYTNLDEQLKKIQKEYKIVKKIGLKVSLLEDINDPIKYKLGLCFDEQGKFHPLKYLYGIVNELENMSTPIFENTRIIEIDGTGPFTLKTSEGINIKANKVIIATKYPILNKKGLMVLKLHVTRTYIVAGYSSKIILDGNYINAEKPTRSLRSYKEGDNELILFVGANHQTGECEDTNLPYMELISYAKKIDPKINLKYRWSTQDCMSLDNIPYIGRLSDDISSIYIGTGFSKWGMTNGTVAAMVVSDMILERNNQWKELFDPKRGISFIAAKELAVQSLDVAGDLIKKLIPLQSMELEDIGKNEGKVIYYKGEKVGVYRDENDEIFAVDPTCRHLGCQVTFNNSERTWDCPCHGSRYTYKGEVLEAPAVKALESLLE